jgi:hypothetical protein
LRFKGNCLRVYPCPRFLQIEAALKSASLNILMIFHPAVAPEFEVCFFDPFCRTVGTAMTDSFHHIRNR